MEDAGNASLRGTEADGPRPRFADRRVAAIDALRWHHQAPRAAPHERARLPGTVEPAQDVAGFGHVSDLGLLAQGVAHDIGNLVAVIANSTVSARQRLGALGSAAGPDLDQIDRAARMVGDISRQLLTLAPDGHNGHEPTDVVAVTEDVVALLARSLGHQVELRLVAGRDADGCQVDVARAEVSQVLVNLVLNACDALEGRAGTVTVAIGLETVVTPATPTPARGQPVPAGNAGALPAGTYVVLAVTDDGPGMSPEVARRAIEPRFSTKPDDAHAGLGLSTVAAVAERAGGHLRLRTAPGAGTTVTVLIPAVPGSVRVAVPSPSG